MKAYPCVERLCEGGVNCVEEGCCVVTNTVEGQNPCLVVQVHPHPGEHDIIRMIHHVRRGGMGMNISGVTSRF